jgi:lysophospholipase L1-like esterase
LKHILIPTIIFSALTLTACGGGGGGDTSSSGSNATQSQNQNQNQSPAPRPKLASVSQVIDYYGDSTVWGWVPNGGGARVQTPAPATFAASLPSTPAHTVNNKGENGQTACQLLNGANGQDDWRTLLAASNTTTVVILNHGINDFTATNIADQVDVGTYRGCLTNLAIQAKEANKRVIFETPNPISREGLAPYVQAMREVAAQQNIPVIDQYAYLTGLLAGNDVTTLIPDGLHPSQSTYDLKGRFAASRFLEIDQ